MRWELFTITKRIKFLVKHEKTKQKTEFRQNDKFVNFVTSFDIVIKIV